MAMKKKKNGYAKYGYIFSIPFVLAYLIFSLYPTFYTAVLGFTDCKGLGNTSFHILVDDPFKNFVTILNNASFQTSIKNTVGLWIVNFIPQIVLALLLTAWFTNTRRKIKGQGFFKVIFYMPNIITQASVAILFFALFGYPMGPINDLAQRFGFISEPYYYFNDKMVARGTVAFIQFWIWYGYTMIILISGVLGINPELYESADIDGANGVQKFFFITIPNLNTILIFTLITSMIGGLNMFDIPKLLVAGTGGGPDNATLTTSVFIYNQAFSGSYLYNRAAAASMIMFVVIAVCSIVVFYLMRDKYEAKERKENKKRERALRKAQKEASL